jgi:hypothetical protein
MRASRLLGILLAPALSLASVVALPTAAPASDPPDPNANFSAPIGSLDQPVGDTVANRYVPPPPPSPSTGPLPLAPDGPPSSGGSPPPIRVALISSGVDISQTIFPGTISQLIARITGLAGGCVSDTVGYGTYASSIVLQLAPNATITSLCVYPSGVLSRDALLGALSYVASNASNFDVALVALPPSHVLDPVSASMAAGQWDYVAETIGVGRENTVTTNTSRQDLVWWQQASLDRFRESVSKWKLMRSQIQGLVAAGVGVVVPAGDVGSAPQTVLGIANLPEVVTVGGFDGSALSPTSSAGPSVEGRVKPDLLALTGGVGLMPPSSDCPPLVCALFQRGLIDSTLQPLAPWPLSWSNATNARASLDTTISAASRVAVAMARLGASWTRDVAKQRAALTAAAVPIAGVTVWRQGVGALRREPDASFAAGRMLVLGHADLGREPALGSWSTTVPVIQGPPTASATTFSDFMGVTPEGRPEILALSSANAHPVTLQVISTAVQVSSAIGEAVSRAGEYCGYLLTSFAGAATTDTTDTDGDLVPDKVEQIPGCLVESLQLKARGFYIHNEPARNLTFHLLPGLVGNMLDHPLLFLPMSPSDPLLVGAVTTLPQGHATIANVPPGYYKVRLWSDYGAPVFHSRDGTSGPPVEADLGPDPYFQDFESLILPRPSNCTPLYEIYYGDPTPGYAGCQKTYLEGVVGAQNVQPDAPTGGFLIGPASLGAARLRVSLGFLRKAPGASVASRYIDLVECEDFRPVLSVDQNLPYIYWQDLTIDLSTAQTSGWQCLPNPRYSSPQAMLWSDHGGPGTLALGVRSYPFKLTTPNYKAHISINIAFEIHNAILLVLAKIGPSLCLGTVGWFGVGMISVPGMPGSYINLGQQNAAAWGEANFDCSMPSYGAPEGTLLVFSGRLPGPQLWDSVASVGDVSFELDTWTNADWPAHAYTSIDGPDPDTAPDNDGHQYSFNPRYTVKHIGPSGPEGQISNPSLCRSMASYTAQAQVCEDWTVLLHSPMRYASTFDLADGATEQSLRGELEAAQAPTTGAYLDPVRGDTPGETSIFTNTFAPHFRLDELSPATTYVPLVTNGEFWEQLVVPRAGLASHPDSVKVCIEDNVPRDLGSLSAMNDAVTSCGPEPIYLTKKRVRYANNTDFLLPDGGTVDGWKTLALSATAGPAPVTVWVPFSTRWVPF